jgi:3-deoxy-7-phosphoheptulonate synthase
LTRDQPLAAAAELHIRETRGRIRRRLGDSDGPLLAIVGPCSIHSEEAALGYAQRLEPVARRLEDDVVVVMRAYFEKPRTTVGWKGFLYDPALDGSCDLAAGLLRARSILSQLALMKLPLATEILDPLVCDYFESFLSWVAIGARTAESQIHRQAASRLPCPVGIKNGTDGSVGIALDAIEAAASSHTHLGLTPHGRIAVRTSPGNPHTHLVLRGGQSAPNYDAHNVGLIAAQLHARGLPARLLVDCSHGNSSKDHKRQPLVADAVLQQLGRPDVDVLGVMVESHLREGRQPAVPLARPDTSVTDACIDFESTELLLERLALAQRHRRAKP